MVLGEGLAALAPDSDVDKGRALLPLALGVLELLIDGNTRATNRHATLGVADLGVAGKVAHQNNFVIACHSSASSLLVSWRLLFSLRSTRSSLLASPSGSHLNLESDVRPNGICRNSKGL